MLRRRTSDYKRAPVSTGYACHLGTQLAEQQFRALRKLIPPDTRDFTARFCGDPIPGDTRRQAFIEQPAESRLSLNKRIRNDGGVDRRYKAGR